MASGPDVILELTFPFSVLDQYIPPEAMGAAILGPGVGALPHAPVSPTGKFISLAIMGFLRAVQRQRKGLIPHAWVEYASFPPHNERLGIWFDAPADLDAQAELAKVPILPGTAQWAIKVTGLGLDGLVTRALPHRLNLAGQEDPNGAIEILWHLLRFQPGTTQVFFSLGGVFHPGSPKPDQNFTVTFTDRLSVQQCAPHCDPKVPPDLYLETPDRQALVVWAVPRNDTIGYHIEIRIN